MLRFLAPALISAVLSAPAVAQEVPPKSEKPATPEIATCKSAAIQALRAKGHDVQETTFGSSVQVAIEEDGGYRGASDPRRGGAPALAP